MAQREGRSWRRVERIGAALIALAFCCAASVAQAAITAQQIVDTSNQLERQRVRYIRCSARVAALDQSIAGGGTARLLTRWRNQRATSQACVDNASAGMAQVEPLLASQRATFLAETGSLADRFDNRLERVARLQRQRSRLNLQVNQLTARIERLSPDAVGNTTEISELQALLEAASSERNQTTADLAVATTVFAELENGGAAGTGGGGTDPVTPPASTGSATLRWAVPTTRADGTALPAGELAGYELYVLSESTGETVVIEIADPLATEHVVDGLAPDTYHFSLSARDSAGNLGEMSAVVSKLIQ